VNLDERLTLDNFSNVTVYHNSCRTIGRRASSSADVVKWQQQRS